MLTEPVNMPVSMEEPMGTEERTITDPQGSVGESTDKKAQSIVFMGEKITAPGSYPDVPALYTPVLDDLYLSCALRQRYFALRYDGIVTESMIDEYKKVREEIWQREYIMILFEDSKPDGYALFDLDGDNNPELLILKNSSRKQTPMICSVFAIRNSFWSRHSGVISADGTIYSVGSGGASCTHLKSYKLDSDTDTLTLLMEIGSHYLESESEIKHYCYQVEGGRSHYISEKEYRNFWEMYRSPLEPMKLTFIPILT